MPLPVSRRRFLRDTALLAGACVTPAAAQPPKKAQIAITLDLEMSRNFPTWDAVEWDYEKGNLNDATKRYTVEACRRVKRAGGVAHCFVVGRVLEQPDVSWLQEIAREGHPLGNHTYDHVNVRATRPEDLQVRFRRAPWLIAGKSVHEVIRDNIRMTSVALKDRIGVETAGFRTPGGFADGLGDLPEVRRLLRDLGFGWISSRYPPHPVGAAGKEPGPDVIQAIVQAQSAAQPFAYPDGLAEVPMSPVSDINAFRSGRWRLEWFLRALDAALDWTIERGAVFDFLGHPSCLYVVDPEFRAVDRICQRVRQAGDRAEMVDLGTIARTRTPANTA